MPPRRWLFWGWQTGFLPVGARHGASRWRRAGSCAARWDLTRADFNRVSDLCTVLLVLVGVYQAVTNESARAVTGIIQWLPLVLLPARRRPALQHRRRAWRSRCSSGRSASGRAPTPRVDLAPAYFGALPAVGQHRQRARDLLRGAGGAAGVGAVARARPRRPAALGRGSSWRWRRRSAGRATSGSAEAQRALERRAQALAARAGCGATPIRYAHDDLARRRRRAEAVATGSSCGWSRGPACACPRCCARRATTSTTRRPGWPWTPASPPCSRSPTAPPGCCAAGRPADAAASRCPPTCRAAAACWRCPTAPAELDDLMVVSLARNRLGAVRVDEGLGLVTYTAQFARRLRGEPPQPPTSACRPARRTRSTRVAEELGLAGRPPAEVRRGRCARTSRPVPVHALPERHPARPHRARGVPAHHRGPATASTSRRRRRCCCAQAGHSGALRGRLRRRTSGAAWRGAGSCAPATPTRGRWPGSTAPGSRWTRRRPVWIAAETGAASAWQPLSDLWEWAAFLFSRWRWSERQDRLTGHLGWLLIPLVALLVWRLWARRRAAAGAAAPRRRRRPARPGAGVDSEFYRVERRLRRAGLRARARRAADALARRAWRRRRRRRWRRPAASAARAALSLSLRPGRAARGRAPAAARGGRRRGWPRIRQGQLQRARQRLDRRLAPAGRGAVGGSGSVQASRTGRRARVYFEAAPALCAASRRSSAVVMPA